jgi:hypothetical protein
MVPLMVGIVSANDAAAQSAGPARPAARPAPPLVGKATFPNSKADSRNPIDYFRELLAMNAEEREAALAEKSARDRDMLTARLKEYEALSPADRELRLRLSQLRFYLVPLMTKTPCERMAGLNAVPAEDRRLIEERLRRWDALSPELQREVLENEWMLHTVLRFEANTPAEQKAYLESLPQHVRAKMERRLSDWNALPADRRQRMLANFKGFFELNEREKAKLLSKLPATERVSTQRALQAFEKLPPDQRATCMKSLQKLMSWTPQQQAEWFKKADEWAKLSPAEQDAIRKLVTQMPPLPPGLDKPPLPPGFGEPPAPSDVILTNKK